MKIADVLEVISDKYLGQKKINIISGIIISCLIFTFVFINYPITFGDPYILIGKRLLFTIDKNFSNCTIQLSEAVEVTKILIFPDFKQKEMRAISDNDINLKVKSIDIPSPAKSTLIDDKFANVQVEIFYPKFAEAKIEKVLLNGNAISLQIFFEENLKIQDKKFINRFYIRDYISNILIKFNDNLSNWLMTFLTFVCIYLFLDLVGYVIIYYSSKDRFEKFICKASCLVFPYDNGQLIKSKIIFGHKFLKRDIWYRFFQIFGPAFGFLFTITSLIAGLHPSAQIGRDVSQFFVAIQVAMTSTFIGLSLRIISMWLQMTNNKIFERAEEVFQDFSCAITKPQKVE